MEECYRNNVVEFSTIYLENKVGWPDDLENEFTHSEFTYYIYNQLFNIDINQFGYGLDSSTMQMTNNIGDLKKYKEDDPKKDHYLEDIKVGDLVFFHTEALDTNSPTPSNRYPGHVGVYIGDKKFIHASPTQEKITIDKIEDKWLKCLVASRDIIKEIVTKDLNR